MDSKVSLCDGHNYDGIVFDVWCVVPTFDMFLCVILGYVTTLGVKIGLKMGLSDTFLKNRENKRKNEYKREK